MVFGKINFFLKKIAKIVTLSSGRSPGKKEKEATEILLLVFKLPIWQNLRIITTLKIKEEKISLYLDDVGEGFVAGSFWI